VAFSTRRPEDERGGPKVEGNANAPVLYMALELNNTAWKMVFGDGARGRQVAVPAGELVKLQEVVVEAKQRFGLGSATRVLSCYEAGRDGFWLLRHLRGVGERARLLAVHAVA